LDRFYEYWNGKWIFWLDFTKILQRWKSLIHQLTYISSFQR
jgi:hypothetical protein